jgi:hypothetical protein
MPAFPSFYPTDDDSGLNESITSDAEANSRLHTPKRSQSRDESPNAITARLAERLPSISRRWKDRKHGLTISTSGSRSYPTSPAASRSSSLNGATRPLVDLRETLAPLSPAPSEPDSQVDLTRSSPLLINVEKANQDPIDREALASTPLLPPLNTDMTLRREEPVQSPLQSPTVADHCRTFSFHTIPTGSPQIPSMPTPPLSSRPSVSSLHRGRACQYSATGEMLSLERSDSDGKWALKLGHANFTIEPEPYLPEVCDTNSCRRVLEEWEEARRNFMRHQVRTGEHYGVTSKTYKWTDEKWSEVDALWKANYELAVATAAQNGYTPVANSPTEPAPLTKMPTLNDPRSQGKFPKLGDEDIVGPMIQVASQIHRRPSRKTAFLNFFSGFKLPGTALGARTTSWTNPR